MITCQKLHQNNIMIILTLPLHYFLKRLIQADKSIPDDLVIFTAFLPSSSTLGWDSLVTWLNSLLVFIPENLIPFRLASLSNLGLTLTLSGLPVPIKRSCVCIAIITAFHESSGVMRVCC